MNKIIVKRNPNFTEAGLAGYMSFNRFEELLRRNHELFEKEKVTGYAIDDKGIKFFIEKI